MINAVFDTVLNHYFEWQHNYVTDSLSKAGHYCIALVIRIR